MEQYYVPDNLNRVIYHSHSTGADKKIAVLLRDTDLLPEKYGNVFEEITDFQFFVHCLSKQKIVEDGKRRLRAKEDGGMNSPLKDLFDGKLFTVVLVVDTEARFDHVNVIQLKVFDGNELSRARASFVKHHVISMIFDSY